MYSVESFYLTKDDSPFSGKIKVYFIENLKVVFSSEANLWSKMSVRRLGGNVFLGHFTNWIAVFSCV